MNIKPSPALIIYFKDYENYHQTRGNKMTHLVGVPGVLFSILGLLSHVQLIGTDLGAILLLIGVLFSLRVDVKLGIPFSLYAILNYLIARHLSLTALTVIQIIAWIIQLWGHYFYEKKSPAFLTTLSHLFVGPMWIFAWVIGYYKPPQSR